MTAGWCGRHVAENKSAAGALMSDLEALGGGSESDCSCKVRSSRCFNAVWLHEMPITLAHTTSPSCDMQVLHFQMGVPSPGIPRDSQRSVTF